MKLRFVWSFLGTLAPSILMYPALAHAADTAAAATDSSKPKDPAADASKSTGFVVERLPASAFPEPKVRGIPGGSLALTFHGLQWPYYPKTGIGVSGSGWVDTSYEKITRGNNHPDVTFWRPQGRFVLRVTPTYAEGNFFVQAQAEVVANNDQTINHPAVADTDDLWVRFGQWNAWDVQVGRYEAWELYHLGMGLDLNTYERNGADDNGNVGGAVQIYDVNFGDRRPSGLGYAALHLYPQTFAPSLDFMRIELLTEVGNQNNLNALGTRPSVVLDFGVLKIKGGGQYRESHGGQTRVVGMGKEPSLESRKERGGGGSVQMVLAPYAEFGVNAATGLVDVVDSTGAVNTEASITVTSYGAFANVRLIEDLVIGAGVNQTKQTNLHKDAEGRYGEYEHLQTFGAIQYLLKKQLYIKLVAAYAKADFDPSFNEDPAFSNSMISTRLRLMYLF